MNVLKLCFWQLRLNIFIITWGITYAQTNDYRFATLGPAQGLQDNGLDFFFEDSNGVIWISSTGGLYRFNGSELKKITKDDGTGLIDNNVQGEFFESSSGNLFFATNKGINQYDHKRNKFQIYQVKDSANQIIENAYRLLFLEKDSLLWLKAGKNIYTYNIVNRNQKFLTKTSGARFLVDTTHNGKVNRIIACPWYYASGFEEYFLEGDSIMFYKKHLEKVKSLDGIKPLMVMNPLSINKENTWLCTDQGLLFFNFKCPDQFELFSKYNGENVAIRRGVKIDSFRFLLNTRRHGLLTFDMNKRQFVKQQIKNQKPSGLTSNSLRGIYYDQNELVWISHQNTSGINYAWVNQGVFEEYNPFGFNESLNAVSSLAQDKEGRIWCVVLNRGVFVLDRKGKKIWQDTVAAQNAIKLIIDKDSTSILVLQSNKIGRIKIASSFIYENLIESESEFFDICQIDSDAWITSTNLGLQQLQSIGNEYFLENIGGFRHFETMNVFADEDKHFYIPTSNNVLQQYLYNKSEKNAILQWETPLENTVVSVCLENKGDVIYVASMDNVYALNKLYGVIEDTLFRNSPFPTQQFLNIIGVGDTSLWLTTYDGLFHYKKEETKHYFFQVSDGLPNTEFIHKSYLTDHNGKLWLGTSKGLISFKPNEIKPYPVGPTIQIENIFINNQPLESNYPHREINSLILKPKENNIKFRAIGLGNYLSKQTQIIYRLEGFEENWNQAPNGEMLSYDRLPSGSYRFVIYGINSNGVKGGLKHFEFIILTPLYEKPVFWIALIAFLIGSFVLGTRYYIRRKLRTQKRVFEQKQALQKALQNERDRIAGEMHDDLGGGLTSIQLLIKRLRRKSEDDYSRELLNKIEVQASGLIENMGEIIWAMNSKYDNLSDLLAYLRLYMIQYLEDQEIGCFVESVGKIPNIIIRGKKRRNVHLVVKEGLHNIVKHSNASFVNISFFAGTDHFKIIIHDNGNGFEFIPNRAFGQGMKNMEKRTKDIHGEFLVESVNGTKLTFKIPFDKEI